MSELFRHRNGRIFLVGQSLSVVGSNALWLAMGIWAKMLTGSNTAAGFTFFALVCGYLTAPAAGVFVDRVSRRTLLIFANFGACAWVAILAAASGRGELWIIYVVMFGYGIVSSTILSAQTALLADMLPVDLLGPANSVLQMADVGLRVVTPLVSAGLLAVIGPLPVIFLDVGTFAAAGLAVTMIRLAESPRGPRQRWRSEFTAGMRYILAEGSLRRLMTVGVIALLAFGFFQTLPYAVASNGLHRSPPFVGVLEAVMGAAALVAGFAAPRIVRRTSEATLMVWSLVSLAAACPFLAVPQVFVVLIGELFVGTGIVWLNVAIYTMIQVKTPNELVGRVQSTLDTTIMVPQTISVALGSSLILILSYRVLLASMAVTFIIAAIRMIAPAGNLAPKQQQDASEAPLSEVD